MTTLLGQVGRENPVELKAQKLARGLARGLVDRDLRPDTSERRRINHILSYPPNRCVRFCLVQLVTACLPVPVLAASTSR